MIYWLTPGSRRFVCLFVCLRRKTHKWLLGRIRSTSLNKHLIKNQLRRSGIKIKGKCSKKATFPLCLPMGVWRWLFFPILVPTPTFCAPPPPPPPVLIWWRQWERFIKSPPAWIDFNSFMNCSNARLWLGGLQQAPPAPLFPRPPLINISMETKWQEIDFISPYIGWSELRGGSGWDQFFVKGVSRRYGSTLDAATLEIKRAQCHVVPWKVSRFMW